MVMNKFLKLLPALALVLTAAFAVAFSFPKTQTSLFGKEGTTWYDVTGIDPDDDTYVCDENSNQNCLFDAPNDLANPISTEMGKIFVVQNESRLVIVEP